MDKGHEKQCGSLLRPKKPKADAAGEKLEAQQDFSRLLQNLRTKIALNNVQFTQRLNQGDSKKPE